MRYTLFNTGWPGMIFRVYYLQGKNCSRFFSGKGRKSRSGISVACENYGCTQVIQEHDNDWQGWSLSSEGKYWIKFSFIQCTVKTTFHSFIVQQHQLLYLSWVRECHHWTVKNLCGHVASILSRQLIMFLKETACSCRSNLPVRHL